MSASIYKLRQRRQRARQALHDSENEGTVHDARTVRASKLACVRKHRTFYL